MVLKKEGATMICKQCGTTLICKLKDYGGNYPPALQWQNIDGTAHYKTDDGKNYSCTVPEEQTESLNPAANASGQMHIGRTAGDNSPYTQVEISMLSEANKKLDHIVDIIERVDEMTQAVFRYTVDMQLRKNNAS